MRRLPVSLRALTQYALAQSAPSETSALAQDSPCSVLVSQPEVSFLMCANLILS